MMLCSVALARQAREKYHYLILYNLIENAMLLLMQPHMFQSRVSFTSLQKKKNEYQFVMQLLFITKCEQLSHAIMTNFYSSRNVNN